MPYIKLKVYGQTVLLDGGMAGMGGIAGLVPWIRQWPIGRSHNKVAVRSAAYRIVAAP